MSPLKDDPSCLPMWFFRHYPIFPEKTKCIDIKTDAML
jgi:hypothetical protein